MNDRENLAALLMTVPPFPSVVFARGSGKRHFVADHIADYLIANGVTFKEQEAQKPLTIEELKQMNGEPVWLPEENVWGIINIDEDGQWAGKPFVTFYYKSVECNYDIQKRKMKCYRHKPKEET